MSDQKAKKSLHRDRPDQVGVNAGHRVRREEKGKRDSNASTGSGQAPVTGGRTQRAQREEGEKE
jgi:hypothetical protein